jgi:hypothetical protein
MISAILVIALALIFLIHIFSLPPILVGVVFIFTFVAVIFNESIFKINIKE